MATESRGAWTWGTGTGGPPPVPVPIMPFTTSGAAVML